MSTDTSVPVVKSDDVLLQMLRVSGQRIVNYCYMQLNTSTNRAIVIDPAWEIDKIKSALAARQCKLEAILLTHHHKDHTNLANQLAREYEADVFMSATEIGRYRFHCENIRPIEGSQLAVAGLNINVLETPGHTAGSVCYQLGNNIFTGDTLFIEGCGECKGEGASAEHLYSSLVGLREKLADTTRVYPGHRFRRVPGMTMKYVRRNNVYLQSRTLDEFVSFHMRERDDSALRYL